MADYFLSCDWGTSSFRLKLISIPDLGIVEETTSNKGISSVFNEWGKKGNAKQGEKQSFYLKILAEYISELESKINQSLANISIVLSGMASSSIGIVDIPYTVVPFAVDGKDLNMHLVKNSEEFPHDVLIISGARTHNDVMRGEETQLIGCIDEMTSDPKDEQLFIFPGTHSKHIIIKDKKVQSFTTYMTGEFFALLSAQSVLHTAVIKHADSGSASESFIKGVKDAANANLLHIVFMVRTNDLFKTMNKEQNYDYLSGLLIGSELKELLTIQSDIFLCCNSNLEKYYRAALTALGLDERVNVFSADKVDRSVIKGQFKILQNKKVHHG